MTRIIMTSLVKLLLPEKVLYFLCKLITVVLTIVPCVCLLRACIATVLFSSVLVFMGGFSGGSDSKASVYNAGDLGLIPGSGRSTGEGNGNPLQDYCLENPMNRGTW